MTNVKKTLFSTQQILDQFRKKAENILSEEITDEAVNLSKYEIKELLHQIQIQHIELEMQNDELKISNEQVESQRYKFEGLFELAPVGYFTLNNRGLITDVNNVGCNLLESVKRSLLNRRLHAFVSPDDSDLFYAFLHRVISTKGRQSSRLSLISPKGNPIYVQMEGILIRNTNLDEKEQCYIAVIDLTERRQAELILQETKERLEMALRASVAGTWQINLKSEEISLDQFSCKIYGIDDCESKQSLDEFVKIIHPQDRRFTSKRFGEAISHRRDLDVEYRIIKSDTTITYVSARGHVIENQGELCFVGILMDITERKELEIEALRLKSSHQKNIMTTILNTQEKERKRISESLHDSVSQLLYGIKLKLNDYKKADKSNKIFSEINKLIDQAVTETRNISFELAPSILTDFGLVTALQEMSKRLSTLELKINTKATGLKDRFELETEVSIFRIIQELVNNSIKHSRATILTIDIEKKNKNLFITVNDNGIGFNHDNVNTSGSGLHSIKNRLDILNGQMEINPAKDGGTIVNIIVKDIAR